MRCEASIVTPTWNNAGRLRIALETMARMVVPEDVEWELLVVNNNCTDHTDDVVAEFEDRLPVRVVYEPQPGLNRARNAGMRAARGALIVYGEDDIRASEAWLAEYVRAFREHPEGYYFGGRIVSEYETGPPEGALRKFAPASVMGLDYGPEEKVLDQPGFIGPNWAARKCDLERLGGFNPDLDLNPSSKHVMIGGEREMMRCLMAEGIQPRYLPEAMVYHYVPAAKCSAKHIADRAEATAYYLHGRELRVGDGWNGHSRLGWWKKYVRQWLRWRLHFLKRLDAQAEYMRVRQMKGVRRARVDAADRRK